MSSVTGSRFGALDPNIGGSPPLLVDREHEARAIARFIVDVGERVVVLYGGARSGKTELVTHWVIPELEQEQGPQGWEVFYGKCEQGLPSILKSRSGNRRLDELEGARRLILVLDNFDRVLALPKDQRRAACDALFERVAREGGEHIVVLVTDARQLTNVYGLSSYEPGLMKAVRELGTASVDESLQGLASVAPDTAVQYTDEALTVLAENGRAIEDRGYEVSFDLIVLVDRHFRELASAGDRHDRTIHPADVARAGGMIGILRDRLASVIRLIAPAAPERAATARTLLEDVLTGRGALPDRRSVALRVGVANDVVDSVAAALLAPGGLLRQAGAHELAFSPAQVAAVVEDEIAADKPFVDQARRIVDEGLRSWTLLGDLLSGERFDEVHRWRRHLALDEDRCRFLLLSALRLEKEPDAGAATAYWLGRVEDREDAQDILLSGTLDKDSKVRARSADHLGAFPNADVQDRLTLIALVDDDADVRTKAVTSLASMNNEVLRKRLIHEIESGPNRLRAIQALRIFPDAKTATVLQQLITNPTERPIREAAIAVLATVNTAESVDALIQVALHDKDEEDRASAAVGLALTRSEDRNRQVVASLGALRLWPYARWAVLTAGILTLANLISVPIAAVLGVAFLTATAPARLITLLAVAALLGYTSRRLVRLQETVRREGKAHRDLPTAFLLLMVLGPLCLVLHGLAHALLGKWRRAATLFVTSLLGAFLCSIASAFVDVPVFGFVLQVLYIVIGATLFVGTYVVDMFDVLAETVLASRAVEQERRKETVYRHLLSNAEVVTLLLHQLRSEKKAERYAARRLVRRFADNARPAQLIDFLSASDPLYTDAAERGFRVTKDHDTVQQLEALWAKANPALRARIADVLCQSPSQSSIQALERIFPELSPLAKARVAWAKIQFRLRVWPRAVRLLGLASLPAIIVFMTYGYSAMTNSEWAMLKSLDRYLHGAKFDPLRSAPGVDVERQMIATVGFLARNYPNASAPELLEHIRSPHDRAASPKMRSALARGLMVIQFDAATDPARVAEITSMDSTLFQAVLFGDSATFARTTDDLAGVRGTNPARVKETTELLRQLILARGPDSVERWKHRAVRAIGAVHYSIALPALDSLLKVRSEGLLAKVARNQFDDVIRRSLDSAKVGLHPEQDAKDLLQVLDSLKPVPAQADVVRRFVEEVAIAKTDRVNDPAFARIQADPNAEEAYAQLLSRFDDNTRSRAALDTFAMLERRYPESIWPRRIIANIQHDRILKPAAFDTAYSEMVGLRALPAYEKLRATDPSTYTTIAADFIEVALSARKFDDVERVGASLLADTTLPRDRRFNAALFIYFARVVQRDSVRAEQALSRVEQLAKEPPPEFYNNWVYPGTRAWLMTTGLSPSVNEAMLGLCKEGFWYSSADAAPVFEKNRAALGLLRGK